VNGSEMSGFRYLIITFGFLVLLFLLSFHPSISKAQETREIGDPIIIQVIQLDYANAENLASVLAPLFPKEVQIIPYSPTNSLIIKGKRSLVKKLVKIIKGNSYLPDK
jgi:type II secretory pathway component GspD/PulD (secretin)